MYRISVGLVGSLARASFEHSRQCTLKPLEAGEESDPSLDPESESILSPPPRYQQRISTLKSALLIYGALLGLSPILKSLTKSTTSDSIWAISTWLLMMNVAFFDYSSGPGAQ